VTGPEYDWKLRELMAMRGMFQTTDLIGKLADRGIELDRSQVYRLVTGKPKPVEMKIATMLALCDILECQITDLAVPVEHPQETRNPAAARKKKAAGGDVVPDAPPVPRSFFDRS
jgi:DNA-binding Xre family transcriptional regulator